MSPSDPCGIPGSGVFPSAPPEEPPPSAWIISLRMEAISLLSLDSDFTGRRPGELCELSCLSTGGGGVEYPTGAPGASGSACTEFMGAPGKGRELPVVPPAMPTGECMEGTDGEKGLPGGARDLGSNPGLPRCRGDRNCGAGIPGLFMGEPLRDNGWELPGAWPWLKATLDPS